MTDKNIKSIRLVGPPSSVHTRLWAESFIQHGHEVEIVGIQGRAFGGLTRTLLRGLRERMLGQRVDVVVVHSLGTHALASLMLPRGRRHVVVPWGSEVVAARRSKARSQVARMVLSRADLVLVTSQAMAGVVADQWRIAEGITKVVSWGVSSLFLEQVDPSSIHSAHSVRARLGVSTDDLLVVAPRGTGQTYRSDELRQAFASARLGRKELRLVVLGADAEGATANDGEVLLPFLPKPELAELFAAADLVVSIPPDDQRSTTVLEAAASGAALVLSDIPPYRELLQLGIDATLVADPVVTSLGAVLAQAARMEPAASQRNRSLMRLHEDQQRQMAQVVGLCITEDKCVSD